MWYQLRVAAGLGNPEGRAVLLVQHPHDVFKLVFQRFELKSCRIAFADTLPSAGLVLCGLPQVPGVLVAPTSQTEETSWHLLGTLLVNFTLFFIKPQRNTSAKPPHFSGILERPVAANELVKPC